MKHLSRFLSLVLVIALSLSLIVVAGAKNVGDYPDTDKIAPQYVEAVDVLTALGVFQGDENGSLNPQGTFTRAQAAKIVTYISIGTTAADRLAHRPSSFTDVSVDHWANPFIEFAVERGIVNGVGGNRFDPEAPVTGAQFAKLMLAALGYGAKNEYIGSSWELNAIVDGQTRGILTVDTDYSAPATREEAIQYTFNTINPVNFAGRQRNYLVKFSNIINDYVLANATSTLQAIGNTGSEQYLGPETFVLSWSATTDNYGRSEHVWKRFGADITANYPDGLKLATSTNGTILQKIGVSGSKYSLTDDASPNYVADLESLADGGYTDATVWRNGVPLGNLISGYDTIDNNNTPNDLSDDVPVPGAISEANTSSDRTGAIVELWDTNYNGTIDKVVIIEKQVGVVTSAPSVNSTTNYVTIGGITDEPVAVTKIDYPSDLIRDDVVLAHKDKKGVLHIEKAKTVTGTVTRTTSNLQDGVYLMRVTLGGELYDETQLRSVLNDAVTRFNFSNFAADQENYNVDATGYLDDNGNLVYVVLNDTGVLNYLYLLEEANAGFAVSAKVVLADGSARVVNLSKVNSTPVSAADSNRYNHFYTYSVNSSGGYDLRSIKAGYEVTLDDTNAGTDSSTAGGIWRSTSFNGAQTISSHPAATNGRPLIADNKTVFIVETNTPYGKTYHAYTGYASVPTYNYVNNSNSYSKAAIGNTYVAKVVFIAHDGSSAKESGVPNYVFFTDILFNYDYLVQGAGEDTYYEVQAIVDNQITTVKVNPALWDDEIFDVNYTGLPKSNLGTVTYDDGIIVSFVPVSSRGTGIGDVQTDRQILRLNGSTGYPYYNYYDSSKLFVITYGDNHLPNIVERYAREVTTNDVNDDWFVQRPAASSSDYYDIGTLFVIINGNSQSLTLAYNALTTAQGAVAPSSSFDTALAAVTNVSSLTSLDNGTLLTALQSSIDAVDVLIKHAQDAIDAIVPTYPDGNRNPSAAGRKEAWQISLNTVKATVLNAKKIADDVAIYVASVDSPLLATTTSTQTLLKAAVLGRAKYSTIPATSATWTAEKVLSVTLNGGSGITNLSSPVALTFTGTVSVP
jgi:hypothetical protein